MLYTFFIFIVFLAELIITVTIIRALLKLDNLILSYDGLIDEANPSVKDISELGVKISEQFVEFAEDFEYRVKKEKEKYTEGLISKLLISLLLLKFNSKAIRKFRKTKLAKRIGMGLTLIKSMV